MTSYSPTSSPSGQSWILSIEASGRAGAIALVPAPQETAAPEPVQRDHSTLVDHPAAKTLLPAIETLLRNSGIDRGDLAGLAVTAGPGSFTGSRIGVTAAKTIAYALDIAAIGVNTQDAIAEALPSLTARRLWIAIDAQRGDLFVAEYQLPWKLSHDWADPTRLVSKSLWLPQLTPGDVVIGPATLEQDLPVDIPFVDVPAPEKVAEGAGRLAWKLLEWGQISSPFELVPRYYRESAAEEKRRLA